MDRTHLEVQLALDEGVRLTVYEDSLGLPTVGIGHLVRPKDQLRVGQRITRERCAAFFAADLDQALADCEALFPTWNTLSEDVQEILANMAFQLGKSRLGKFKNMRKALGQHDYHRAAEAMRDSLWYKQTPQRAERLIRRMEQATHEASQTLKEESRGA